MCMLDKVMTSWYGVITRKECAAMNVKPKEKTEVVQIRLTPAEKETLRKLAGYAGLSISGYLLGKALGDAIGQTIIEGFDRKK